MELTKHNPYCKLVDFENLIYDNGRYLDLVYAISNEGDREGLEVYCFKTNSRGMCHYRSYRWETEDIPPKYMDKFLELKSYVDEVPDGHKLRISN